MKIDVRIAIVLTFLATLLIQGATRAQTPMTERVSVDSNGIEGDFHSQNPVMSTSGRFVAFESTASNLVAGDTNSQSDIFVRDRQLAITERVNVDSGGAQANYNSYRASISADGRFVAFESRATNLVAGDTNSSYDVFVRDRTIGSTERVSISTLGAQGNYDSVGASVSGDGRFVAFCSPASTLVSGDWNGSIDVFVRDRQSGTTMRVSVDSLGLEGNRSSYQPSFSADGRYIAYLSEATNLVAGDTNNLIDAFVRDQLNGTTERISVSTGGAQANADAHDARISADGRYASFTTSASSIVAGDLNGTEDVFVRDRISGTTERVSVATGGTEANMESGRGSCSVDGRWVVFASEASNLVGGDTNSCFDIFIRDRSNGTTQLVSVNSLGVEGRLDSYVPTISPDGRFVVFWSAAANLVVSDMNDAFDVFLHDRGVAQPSIYCTSSTSSNGCSASIAASAYPSVSLAHACTITVTNVEGLKSGIVFYGIDNAGFSPGPWAPGSTSLQCVKPPTQRTPIQNSGGTFGACDGSYVLNWNAYQSANPFALGNPWSVGDKVYVQAWFRDPLAVKGTNLSNAVEMTYGP